MTVRDRLSGMDCWAPQRAQVRRNVLCLETSIRVAPRSGPDPRTSPASSERLIGLVSVPGTGAAPSESVEKAQPAAGAGVPKFASVEFEAFDASSARSEEPAEPPEPSRPRPPRGRERATSARAFGVHTRLSARTHASAPSGARGAARRGSGGWRRSCRRAPRGRGGARRLGGPRRARRDEDVFEVFRSSALRQISRAVRVAARRDVRSRW